MKNQYCNVYFYSNGIYGLINDSLYSAKTYTYKNSYNYKFKVGDNILVHINDKDVAIAKVIEVFDEKSYHKFSDCSKGILKTVMGVVDVKEVYEHHKKQRRLAELNDQIEELYKKVSKIQLLETMCEGNEELTKMLKEYKELTKG